MLVTAHPGIVLFLLKRHSKSMPVALITIGWLAQEQESWAVEQLFQLKNFNVLLNREMLYSVVGQHL